MTPAPFVPADAPILTTAAMRAAELAACTGGVTLAELMQRAGAAVADHAWRMAAGREILILCGPGNNGGDGYVAARLLATRGASVRLAGALPPASPLAMAAAGDWRGAVEPLNDATCAAPCLVDALFGTGLTRALDAGVAAPLARLVAAADRVLAVDVPSGFDSDTAAQLGGAGAQVTVALGALKPAHVLLPAAAWCGDVRVADIGIADQSAWRTARRTVGPGAPPRPDDHKFTRGSVLVIAGGMAGAAGLAAGAALRAGAGHVVLSSDAPAMHPAAVIREGRAKLGARLADARTGAVLAGQGMGEDEAADMLPMLMASGRALVLDAGMIDAVAQAGATLSVPTILTPHEGEFARAFPGLSGSKIDRTIAAARRSGAIVVHKGADTVVAAPDGRVTAGWPGVAWLATAGSGDVLAGAMAAALAGGGDAFVAASRALAWHQSVARRAGAGLIADDLIARGMTS